MPSLEERKTPVKNMRPSPQMIIKESPTQLAQEGVRILNAVSNDAVRRSGRCAIAVSGGSTPRRMHRILAEEPWISNLPWEKIHIFWVDERCVPEWDPASNYGIAKDDFLRHVPVPKSQVHPMPADLAPQAGAKKYARELTDFFHLKPGLFPAFDLIFLGMGLDGHTASLFPGQKALNETDKLVAAVKGGDPYVNRLTLTLPVLKMGRRIVFLVSGKQKAPVVAHIFKEGEPFLPVQKIRPEAGSVTWIMDREAASVLLRDEKDE